jgi:alkanesulfonate monooxygenase SsuD/methylene tetrahydromethanopterin reductase-like flavin-dependent oxidoreductase (luciferase family)
MRINLMIEPQEGMTYSEILAVARRADELGFEGLYRSDHYASVFGREGVGSTDAWTTLAGLVRETERIALGTLVSPVTFRPAANLAKVVATVAEMAGTAVGQASRVHLGMGTGWLVTEHTMYGLPFDDLGTRFRRLEEQLQILRGLWDSNGEPFSFHGEFEGVKDAQLLPRPDPRPRVIVGGRGPVKIRAVLDDACERDGRDPSTITFSLMTGCLVGATTKDFRARVRRLETLATRYPRLADYHERLAVRGVVGTPDQATDRIGRLAEAGVERIMLQHLFHDDLDLLDVVAEEIVPRLETQAG